MASIISTKTSGGGGIAVTGDTSGIMQLASNNGTTAVTIDASQNVGIGTTSPQAKLQINDGASSSNATLRINNPTNSNTNYGASILFSNVDTNTYLGGISALRTNNSANYSAYLSFSYSNNGALTEGMLIDSSNNLQFNSGYGSVATAYGCRAWVNFNGQGTVAIRASGNVSSITDLGAGYYQVNFTNAMPDTNYSVAGAGQYDTGGVNADVPPVGIRRTTNVMQTTNVKISISGGFDCFVVCVNIFR